MLLVAALFALAPRSANGEHLVVLHSLNSTRIFRNFMKVAEASSGERAKITRKIDKLTLRREVIGRLSACNNPLAPLDVVGLVDGLVGTQQVVEHDVERLGMTICGQFLMNKARRGLLALQLEALEPLFQGTFRGRPLLILLPLHDSFET